MLLVQEYLKNHSFKQLIEDHGVYASFSKSGHKWSLNYDQLEAKESDLLATQCRGLILACKDGKSLLPQAKINGDRLDYTSICPGETTILSYGMDRFFNHGQGSAAPINWEDPKLAIMEKLDGTLIMVYFDPFIKQWCVATRGVPEADLPIDGWDYTFRTLFEKAVQDTLNINFDVFTKSLVKEMTYCFELTTPYNRIVVKYDNCRITLLACRYLPTLNEINPQGLSIVEIGGVPCVRTYTFTSVKDLVDLISSQNPLEHEGVVIKDSDFNRRKLKNPSYVAYNRARDILGASDRNCLELILAEKDDDVAAVLPSEILNNLTKIKQNVKIIIDQYDQIYQEVLAEANTILPGNKKTFALLLAKRKQLWSAPLFQMFDGKACDMKDFIRKSKNEGTWSNSFLDRILELSKAVGNDI